MKFDTNLDREKLLYNRNLMQRPCLWYNNTTPVRRVLEDYGIHGSSIFAVVIDNRRTIGTAYQLATSTVRV